MWVSLVLGLVIVIMVLVWVWLDIELLLFVVCVVGNVVIRFRFKVIFNVVLYMC